MRRPDRTFEAKLPAMAVDSLPTGPTRPTVRRAAPGGLGIVSADGRHEKRDREAASSKPMGAYILLPLNPADLRLTARTRVALTCGP